MADSRSRRTCTVTLRSQVPAGQLDGLPIGLQILGRHFSEPLLLELALTMERHRPWPLTSLAT